LFFKYFFYFVYMCVLSTCVSMHHMYAWCLSKWPNTMWLLGTEPSTLQEQVLLTTELTLQTSE
jgi:ABC-type multidrug transport system permease subunit